MLALVFAVLAQVPDVRVTRVERVEYGRAEGGRSGVRGLAFFEFAPASGAGMGVAGAAPNWLLQSEDFTTTWVGNAGVVAAPTVTANYEGVSDRVQIPATTPPTQYSRLLQGVSVGWPGGPMTCSVEVKGTSNSGSIPIYVLTGFPNNKAVCAFNATSYTTCSVSWTSVGSGGDNFYIGPSGASGDGSFPAIDVLLRNAQCNPGPIVAPYIRTTTAAAGYRPTGAKGEALTFTRTGTAFATKTASGGLATTGIANGDLVLMPGDTPRVEYDSQGVLGLRVESARTNDALQSEQWDSASWSPLSAGVALPTVSANATTSPDGAQTAERLQIPATTSGQYSYVSQSGFSAVARVTSFYVRGNGTSGSINLLSGVTPNACVACSYVSGSWTRCALPTSGTAGTVFFIGNDSVSAVCGTTNKGAQDVFVWGAQHEAGAYVTSYIPTTTAAVTRNAEQADLAVPSLTVSAPFSLAATVSLPNGVPTNARLHGTLGPTGLATFVADSYASGLTWTAESTQVSPISYTTGRTVAANGTYRAATYHDGTNFNGCIDGTCGAGVARAWTNLGSVVLYRVGAYTSSNGVIDGIQSRVCFQNDSATRCR